MSSNFNPAPTTDHGVTCPWAFEKSMYNVVNTLAPSFFIGSSSFLQVERTTIKSRMSLTSWVPSDFPIRVPNFHNVNVSKYQQEISDVNFSASRCMLRYAYSNVVRFGRKWLDVSRVCMYKIGYIGCHSKTTKRRSIVLFFPPLFRETP